MSTEQDGEVAAAEAPAAFNPHKYLTLISGRDYLEVKWRLVWLRSLHPDATIETEMIRDDGAAAVFKAKVTLPTGGSATGWGSESYQDFADYIEKAETKAIGRALGALGFGTQFTYEFDEGEREGERRVVDSPVGLSSLRQAPSGQGSYTPRTSTGMRQAGRPEPATEKQIKAVYAIGRAGHLSDAEIVAFCQQEMGQTPEQLSRRMASELIDRLKQQMAASVQRP